MNRSFLIFIIPLLALTACSDPVFTPKPRGYPRIEFPERTGTRPFDQSDCPFSFELPKYYQVLQDSFFFEEEPAHSCWFDLLIPEFDSRLHCSYFPVGAKGKTFDDLRSDAFDLANWHNKKANYIDEIPIKTPHNVEGMFFAFEGPVASHYQFYLTDSLHRHFFRAALYFNTQSKPDSLAPMYDFVRQDVDGIINSFRWE
jgi:gliding motility-associated lipoprotein GldD